jgi:hypothetical protein
MKTSINTIYSNSTITTTDSLDTILDAISEQVNKLGMRDVLDAISQSLDKIWG